MEREQQVGRSREGGGMEACFEGYLGYPAEWIVCVKEDSLTTIIYLYLSHFLHELTDSSTVLRIT